MQTTLNFRFPSQRQQQQQQRDVAVQVVIPLPQQRPMATANYLFMCTGELPSSEVLSALGVPTAKIMGLSAESLSNSGLKPFAESSVVRIEKNVMVEIGSSTTKTIFGGFIEDEPLKDESQKPQQQQEQQQLCAGTVLIGNVGMPNSNASRYYILLEDITEATQREELSVYQSIGHITVGLNELREACAVAAVHSRTLAPQPPVKLWVSDVHFNYSTQVKNSSQLTAEQRSTRTGIALTTSSTLTSTLTRMAGRVRRREETEAEDAEMNNTAEDSGFFHLTRSYPAPQNNNNNYNNNKGIGPQAKRLRSERLTASDGESALTGITALPPVEGEPFDFFAAQEAVFLTDVGIIKETQTLRRNRRGKQQPQKMRQKHDKINRLVMTGNSKGERTASAGTKKTLRRRY